MRNGLWITPRYTLFFTSNLRTYFFSSLKRMSWKFTIIMGAEIFNHASFSQFPCYRLALILWSCFCQPRYRVAFCIYIYSLKNHPSLVSHPLARILCRYSGNQFRYKPRKKITSSTLPSARLYSWGTEKSERISEGKLKKLRRTLEKAVFGLNWHAKCRV